jgi:hypothetical protein
MRVAFVGDIYLGASEDPWLSAQVPELHQALGVDLVVGNFESTVDGPLVGEPHPGKIHLSVPSASLAKLKNVGVDRVSIANNHVADYGREGTLRTIQALQSTFGSDGVFGWRDRPAAELWPGLNVVGLCDLATHPVALDGDLGIATPADLARVLNRGGADQQRYVLFVHWGKEHLNLTAQSTRDEAHRLLSSSTPHIIGVHSHVIGAFEGTPLSGVVYSLGNFIFAPYRSGTTKLVRRNRRGAVAVYDWDGGSARLAEFWRSEFDERLNLQLRRIAVGFPGSVASQLHLKVPGPLSRWSYGVTESTQWIVLGLSRLLEGVDRPSLKKVRTALYILTHPQRTRKHSHE